MDGLTELMFLLQSVHWRVAGHMQQHWMQCQVNLWLRSRMYIATGIDSSGSCQRRLHSPHCLQQLPNPQLELFILPNTTMTHSHAHHCVREHTQVTQP